MRHPQFRWWYAYAFDNPLRRLLHDPKQILREFVSPGDTVVDIGCGLGFFTVALARLVGSEGRVIAVDIRPEMLERTGRRVRRRGFADRVELLPTDGKRLGIDYSVDFVLAFWMLHEVRERTSMLSQIRTILRPDGRLLIAEPLGHVSPARFAKIVRQIGEAGFDVHDGPAVRFSRTALCSPPPATTARQ